MIRLGLNARNQTDVLDHIANLVLATGSFLEPLCAPPRVEVKPLGYPLGTLEQPWTVLIGDSEVEVEDNARIVPILVLAERNYSSVGEVLLST